MTSIISFWYFASSLCSRDSICLRVSFSVLRTSECSIYHSLLSVKFDYDNCMDFFEELDAQEMVEMSSVREDLIKGD